MKKIKEVIVVEGTSDVVTLSNLIDADFIITHGSAISQETLDLIKVANETRGVIIFTDPDFPGEKIRKTIIDYIGDCKHAFVRAKDAKKKKPIEPYLTIIEMANKRKTSAVVMPARATS